MCVWTTTTRMAVTKKHVEAMWKHVLTLTKKSLDSTDEFLITHYSH